MSENILVVEDDGALGHQIVGHLVRAGFQPTWIADGDEALLEDPEPYAMVILDLMLPGAYGLDVLKSLRRTSDVPVMVLSARNETRDKVRALELGADDFVSKPFWPEELVARVRARLRRPTMRRDGVLDVGEIAVDVAAHRVRVSGRDVALTPIEFDLLAALARRPGDAIARTWFVDHVLDPDRDGTERTLDVHVSRLRKKLGRAAAQLTTVWGIGYRLVAEAAAKPGSRLAG
jgi:two-component system response regulator MtrA